MNNEQNELHNVEATVLGKRVDYPQHYAPHILVAVPRCLNREQYGIADSALPFVGVDAWHAYELSFLTETGMPVVALLKITYPADSGAIVESKSLKLYLNSFNMDQFGRTPAEGLQRVKDIVGHDLSALLQTNVSVEAYEQGVQTEAYDFADYAVLERMPEALELRFEHYNEAPEVLTPSDQSGEMRVCSHLLRSNCKITHQPDWGSVFISMKGEKLPTMTSLLQYIVSARGENHFHEEICEMIYKRLWDIFGPAELMVTCVYTRRGGIDICPSRASEARLLPEGLCSAGVLTAKMLRQ